MSDEKQVLTQTAIRSFRKCPRFFEQYYEKLMRPTTVSDPLAFGTIWHELREVWWKAGEVNVAASQGMPEITIHFQKSEERDRIVPALNKFAQIRESLSTRDDGAEVDEFTLNKLLVMLRGYHERWNEYVNSLDVLGVEVPYEIPLVNPRTGKKSLTFIIQGKLDAVVREDGRLWVVEEKTAGEMLTPESPYWRRLEVDPQCSLYYDAVERTYGEKPAGIMYFVNVKPQQKPLKATPIENRKYTKATAKEPSRLHANQRGEDETPSEYAVRLAKVVSESPERFYQMVRVARLESDIRESQIDVWDTAKAIREAKASGLWLRNPDACIHPFGSTCAFLPVCTHRASLDDVMLYRKAAAQHEELAT